MTGTHRTETGPRHAHTGLWGGDVVGQPPRQWIGTLRIPDGDGVRGDWNIPLWGPGTYGGYFRDDRDGRWWHFDDVTDLVPAVVQPEATPDEPRCHLGHRIIRGQGWERCHAPEGEATPDADDEIERLTAVAVDVWRSDQARTAAEDAYQANSDPSPVHGRDVGRLARMGLVVRAVLAARRSAGEA